VILSAYALLVALPVALGWWLIGPARPWLDEASSAIAMMATAALLLEFLLSGRFRVISAGIGMDRSLASDFRANPDNRRVAAPAILSEPKRRGF
jgi:hypothetical protein